MTNTGRQRVCHIGWWELSEEERFYFGILRFEFKDLTAAGKKLLAKRLVFVLKFLYRRPDGRVSKTLNAGCDVSFVMDFAFLINRLS